MSEASTSLHEPAEQLSEQTRDLHRALVSLQEELEAVDWYRQRADVCTDSALGEILRHNMREEIEHASMLLEWLRRNNADFQRILKTYLFSEGSITEAEALATGTAAVQTEQARPESDAFTIGRLRG
jgi:ferritin-like protein